MYGSMISLFSTPLLVLILLHEANGEQGKMCINCMSPTAEFSSMMYFLSMCVDELPTSGVGHGSAMIQHNSSNDHDVMAC